VISGVLDLCPFPRRPTGQRAGGGYNGTPASPANASWSPPIPADEPTGTRSELTLGPEARGARLDRALADRLPEHSRTAIAAWIRAGRVEVEARRLAARTKMAGGERVVLWIPAPEPSHLEPQDLPLDILHEEAAFIILNKPPGLTVHPGAGQRDGTLANALAFHLQGLPSLGGADRPGIVHRLDKQTSGVMVVARSEVAHRALSQAFAKRRVSKTYRACVHGHMAQAHGVVDRPLGRSKHARTKWAVDERGRAAWTAWEVEDELPRHSLLLCRPRTGRTHQIRVHLAHLHHPIVGDPSYGFRNGPGEARAPRLLLHAFRLAFPHPTTGEEVCFEAPLPEDFRRALEALAQLDAPRRRR